MLQVSALRLRRERQLLTRVPVAVVVRYPSLRAGARRERLSLYTVTQQEKSK
jgi:hypothetical protein